MSPIYYVALITAIILLVVLRRPKKKKPSISLYTEMARDYFQLRQAIESCKQYDELGNLEDQVDGFYNDYNGRMYSETIRTYSNDLYTKLSIKGIELCGHASI
jgi:hypothetical protein